MFYGDYMVSKVVSNTGPLIHLEEIKLSRVLGIFKNIFIPEEVKNELEKYNILLSKKIKVMNLRGKFKDVAEILVNKFSLDLGESQAISLALQEKADYFLTDDLDARIVANSHGLESHGTIGIISRAFREKIINKETTIKKMIELYESSSLFITKDLINQVIKSIKDFKGV
jgi:predicted nucleic acid-binding protein